LTTVDSPGDNVTFTTSGETFELASAPPTEEKERKKTKAKKKGVEKTPLFFLYSCFKFNYKRTSRKTAQRADTNDFEESSRKKILW